MEKLNIRSFTVMIAAALVAISSSAMAGPGFRFSSKAPVMHPKPQKLNGYVFGYGGIDFGHHYHTVGAFDEVGHPDWDDYCPHPDPGTIDPSHVPIAWEMERGWTAGGGVGAYSALFGGSRFEIEGSYTKNAVDTGVLYVDFGLPADFDITTTAVMFNMLKEVPLGRATSYFGGGVGYASTRMKGDIATIEYDDSDSGFAWQLIAGLDIPLTERLAFFTQYRYLVLSNLSHTTVFGDFTQTTTDNPSSHAVLFGLRLSY